VFEQNSERDSRRLPRIEFARSAGCDLDQLRELRAGEASWIASRDEQESQCCAPYMLISLLAPHEQGSRSFFVSCWRRRLSNETCWMQIRVRSSAVQSSSSASAYLCRACGFDDCASSIDFGADNFSEALDEMCNDCAHHQGRRNDGNLPQYCACRRDQ
jgi:hypothetical protein